MYVTKILIVYSTYTAYIIDKTFFFYMLANDLFSII